MRPRSWKAWLAAGLLFVCGAAVGSIVTVRVGQRMLRHALLAPVDAPAPIDRSAQRMERQLARALDLDASEQAQVGAAISQSVHDLKQLRVETARRVQQILNDGVHAAGAGLTPAQRAKLYELAGKRMDRIGLVLTPAPAAP